MINFIVNAFVVVAYVLGGIALDSIADSGALLAFYGYVFGMLMTVINFKLVELKR